MSKIVLKGLSFFAYHGVFAEEAVLGTRFVVDVEMQLALPEEDEIYDTVHYGEVYELVRAEVTEQRYKLIESLTQSIAKRIMHGYPKINAVTVRVHKPSAPIAGIFEDVYIEHSIER